MPAAIPAPTKQHLIFNECYVQGLVDPKRIIPLQEQRKEIAYYETHSYAEIVFVPGTFCFRTKKLFCNLEQNMLLNLLKTACPFPLPPPLPLDPILQPAPSEQKSRLVRDRQHLLQYQVVSSRSEPHGSSQGIFPYQDCICMIAAQGENFKIESTVLVLLTQLDVSIKYTPKLDWITLTCIVYIP